MHDNLDFNVNLGDDSLIGDKQSLIAAKGYGFDEESVPSKPKQATTATAAASTTTGSSSSQSKSNFLSDFFSDSNSGNTSEHSSASDVLPVSSSAYDLTKSAHPVACIFTFIFKAMSFIAYYFFSIYFSNTVFIFVMVLTFNALDFWTVKNITGRLLIGMRWWNEANQLGIEEYQCETKGPEFRANQVDYAFFWSSQLIFTIYWTLVAVLHLLSPFWLFLDIITVSLLFSNLYGFYKCRSDHQQQVNSVKNNLKLKGFSLLGSYLSKK